MCRWKRPIIAMLLCAASWGAHLVSSAKASEQIRGTEGEDLYCSAASPSDRSPCECSVECCCVEHCHGTRCSSVNRLWIKNDLLLWWLKGYDVPIMVADGPPDFATLYGAERTDDTLRAGVRTRIGYWFDDCGTFGMEPEFFLLGEANSSALFVAPAGGVITRTFVDAASGAQAFEFADRVNLNSDSTIYSFAVPFRLSLAGWSSNRPDRCGGFRVDAIGGYRHLRLKESLTISELATFPGPSPTTFDIVDEFETDNRFHGGEFGLVTQFCRGPWTMELLTKVAIGNVHENVRIRGSNTATTGGVLTFVPHGILAQPSNIGSSSDDQFAVLPELGAQFAYCLSRRMRVTAGYSYLYLSHTIRPGDQIDSVVDARWLNPNFVPPGTPPATRPAPMSASNSVWLQGITLGLEWRY